MAYAEKCGKRVAREVKVKKCHIYCHNLLKYTKCRSNQSSSINNSLEQCDKITELYYIKEENTTTND